MEYMEFSAKTVADAITDACQKFTVTGDKLDYVVENQSSAGFLGIGVGLFVYLFMIFSLLKLHY